MQYHVMFSIMEEVAVYSDLNYGTEPPRCNFLQDFKRPKAGISKTTLDLYIPLAKEKTPRKTMPGHFKEHTCINPGVEHDGGAVTRERCTACPSRESPILVVFVHGGGWRRGHSKHWRHFVSRFDTNLLVALYSKYCNYYGNVGESFARSGCACAVVTYPFVVPPTGVVLVETLTSFLMSWLLLFLLPVVLLYYLTWLFLHVIQAESDTVLFLHEMLTPWQVQLAVSILASQMVTKGLVILNSTNYRTAPSRSAPRTVTVAKSPRPRLTRTAALFVVSSTMMASVILYIIIYVCTGSQLRLLAAVDIICTQTLITATQLWNWSKSTTDTVQHGSQQVQTVAEAIGWLQQLASVKNSLNLYDPTRIILCGHSAGGSIVSLLGLDPKYLTSAGVDLSHIKGIISISGIYDLSSMSKSSVARFLYLVPAFGTDPGEWKRMSPVHRITNFQTEWKPQFLVISSSWEPTPKRDADDFVFSLLSSKFDCERLELSTKNHFNILNLFTSGNHVSVLETVCADFIGHNLAQHMLIYG